MSAADKTGALPSLLQPGAKVLGERFQVTRLLGGGGMGEVYLGEQISLGRKVALKVLRQNMSADPQMAERFRREALLLSSVEHAALVRVIDFGTEGATAILVMELVEGSTLELLVRDGPLAPARAVPLLAQLAQGLAAIHARGIIHRDLKTENVIVSPLSGGGEQARLLDFGIARLVSDDAPVTQQGLVMGTPQYISPEQATGGAVDARTDLYAFGVLAFRVLTGAFPFKGPSARDFLTQHVAAPPLRLDDVVAALAQEPLLCAVVRRCLAKDPAERPASAQALASELQGWKPGAGAGAQATTSPTGTALFGVTPATVGTGATPRTASNPSVRIPFLSGSFDAVPRPQNVALMLTDIEGFTQLTAEQTRDQNAALLETHDRLLLPVVRAYTGKVVQKRGDALLVVFKSPTEAVHCAMGMQDALHRHNAHAQPRLNVRIVLDAGEVVVARDGVVGEPMRVVEALEQVARAGEIVFSESLRLAMNRAEVPHAPYAEIDAPGRGGKLALYKATPSATGLPFGGRDQMGARGGSDLASLAATAQVKVTRARAFLLDRSHPGASGFLKLPLALRRAMVAVPALALAMLAGGLYLDPTAQITRALEAGEYTEALRQLDAQAAPTPRMKALRAAALHGLRRHGEEAELLNRLDAEGWAEVDGMVLKGIIEDAARSGLGAQHRELLRKASPSRLASAFDPERISAEDVVVVRALDTLHDGRGLNRVSALIALLRSEECSTRGFAARRLGELGDAKATDALAALAAIPKEQTFLADKNCGQDEARSALKKLSKAQ